MLRPPSGAGGSQWELQCRDGWEWRSSGGTAGAGGTTSTGADLVLVRVATVSSDQAIVLQDWLERIKSPAVWWAVSRELQSPDSAPDVAQALRASPWLAEVLPVVLEASVDGAPPRPTGDERLAGDSPLSP